MMNIILHATCMNIVRNIHGEDALIQRAILNVASRILFLTRNYIESTKKEILFNHNLKCPKCVDIFNQLETLDNHLHNEHSILTDYAELSLASDC